MNPTYDSIFREEERDGQNVILYNVDLISDFVISIWRERATNEVASVSDAGRNLRTAYLSLAEDKSIEQDVKLLIEFSDTMASDIVVVCYGKRLECENEAEYNEFAAFVRNVIMFMTFNYLDTL